MAPVDSHLKELFLAHSCYYINYENNTPFFFPYAGDIACIRGCSAKRT
jgi:hypothetical protein